MYRTALGIALLVMGACGLGIAIGALLVSMRHAMIESKWFESLQEKHPVLSSGAEMSAIILVMGILAFFLALLGAWIRM